MSQPLIPLEEKLKKTNYNLLKSDMFDLYEHLDTYSFYMSSICESNIYISIELNGHNCKHIRCIMQTHHVQSSIDSFLARKMYYANTSYAIVNGTINSTESPIHHILNVTIDRRL